METYGATMRRVREQKGYTMKQVAKGIVSVSFLSKFERGESEISLRHFMDILDRLSVTVDEFHFMHRNDRLDPLKLFFRQMSQAYTEKDLKKLGQLKKQELQKWKNYRLAPYQCNVLAIEVMEHLIYDDPIDAVDNEALKVLRDYLFHVEVWGYYELMLYNATLLLMPAEMVVVLSKTAYEKSGKYQNMKEIRDIIFRILVNTMINLLGPVNVLRSKITDYPQASTHFFSCLEELSDGDDQLFEKVHLQFIKGVYQVKTGDVESGKNKVHEAIAILHKLGSHRIANDFERYLDLTLEHLEKR